MIWLVALASAQSGAAYPSVQLAVQGADAAHTSAAQHAVITVRPELWGCFSKGRFEVAEPEGVVVVVRQDGAWTVEQGAQASNVDGCLVGHLDAAPVPDGDVRVVLTVSTQVPPEGSVVVDQVVGDPVLTEPMDDLVIRQRYCYGQLLLNEHVSPGAVRFHVQVDGQGAATASLEAGSLPPDLQACMIEVLQGFPYPAGPAQTQVTYTLAIQP